MSRPRSIQRSLWLVGALLVAPLLGALRPAPVAAATFPAGFDDALVANVGNPTALAFTPGGLLLVTRQGGQLLVYRDSTPLATALDLGARVCANSERGLLGVAVNPNFASNRAVFLSYTFNKFGTCPTGQPTNPNNPVNRVSRFTLAANNTIDPASEVVLIDNMPSPNGNHNGGDLNFGKDGYLYATIGDGGCDYNDDSGCAGDNDAARDGNVLTGKVLRITRDGAIPPGNPFQGVDSARCNVAGRTDPGKECQETFAKGLRNPFRFAFDPNAAGTRFLINDVGQGAWEEIDEGQAGADYGWNVREGRCANGSTTDCGPPPAGLTNPIYDYGRGGGCGSITGGAFVPGGAWPAEYAGGYLFADYVCGKIFLLKQSGGTWVASDFATGLGSSSAVHLRFGAYCGTQALYYTTYAGGGQVRRVVPGVAVNCGPTAALVAAPTSGPVPLVVNFDGAGSGDPNPGDTLTYLWDFGDGAMTTTSGPTVAHTYAANGTYTAALRVRDSTNLTSAPATAQISVGNSAPVPQIAPPAGGARYRTGVAATLTGGATDAEDGALPGNRLSWTIILRHNTHTHPFVGPVAGPSVTFTPLPHEEGTAWLEVRLTATDSQGLAATTTLLLLRTPDFSDVSPTDPAFAAIDELGAYGVVRGYDAAGCAARGVAAPCFAPGDTSLRAQMAALIVRAMGWGGEAATNPFTDGGGLDPELWDAVAILAARGVALGYGDGRFGPNDTVTQAQVASFIARAMIDRGYWQPAPADDLAVYPNVPASSGQRLDLVTYVRNAGPLPDHPAAAPWPDWSAPATRAWFARTLHQALAGHLTEPVP